MSGERGAAVHPAPLDAQTVARYESRLRMEQAVEAIRQLERAFREARDEELHRLRAGRAARAEAKARDDAAYAAWKRDHPKEATDGQH